MTTQTYYQLTHEYGDYSHSEAIMLDSSYDLVKEALNELVQDTIDEGDSYTDALSIESVLVELDEDGEVEDVLDYLAVIEEVVFNPA
jgi:hypothetical protein